MKKIKLSRRQFISQSSVLALGVATNWRVNASLSQNRQGLNSSDHNKWQIPEQFHLAGLEVIKQSTVIDLHSHPGRFFLKGADNIDQQIKSMTGGFEAKRIADMRRGQVSAALFSVVSDLSILGLTKKGIAARRDFLPGEAYTDFKRQLAILQKMVKDSAITQALSAEDIINAKKTNTSVAIFSCEGANFVENHLERIEEAYDAGVRSIGLVHYSSNVLGDIQTEPTIHGGLTKLGGDVVKEMNRLGIIIDLAHATQKTCEDALSHSSSPVIVSHSNLLGNVKSPRFLNNEHASMIAKSGGLIGAWPSGLDSHNLLDFANQVVRLVEHVGVDHVAIGTDMDGNYKPVLTDYVDFSTLASLLLFRGLSASDCKKIFGGNFLRVFAQVSDLRTA